MEAEGCGATGALASLAPKHSAQPRRAKPCSGPQTLSWGEGSSRTHGLALGGGHAGAPPWGLRPAKFVPQKTAWAWFFITHHSVIAPGHGKPQHLVPGGFWGGGSPFAGMWQEQSGCTWG